MNTRNQEPLFLAPKPAFSVNILLMATSKSEHDSGATSMRRLIRSRVWQTACEGINIAADLSVFELLKSMKCVNNGRVDVNMS